MRNKIMDKDENIEIDLNKLLKNSVSADEVFASMNWSEEDKKEIEDMRGYYTILMEVRETRKKNHITQEELAKKSGIPRSTISQIESGKRNTTIDTLCILAEAMGKQVIIKFV
jgi:DNA-binding XRE family transcriptional regulator